MEYEIRKLTASDGDLALALMKAWHADEPDDNPEFPDRTRTADLIAQDTFHAYVALVNGEVVGGLTAYELPMFYQSSREVFLYEVGVRDTFRRKGMARALVEALQETCREKEIKTIYVATELQNFAARKLYETTGAEVEILPWYTYQLK